MNTKLLHTLRSARLKSLTGLGNFETYCNGGLPFRLQKAQKVGTKRVRSFMASSTHPSDNKESGSNGGATNGPNISAKVTEKANEPISDVMLKLQRRTGFGPNQIKQLQEEFRSLSKGKGYMSFQDFTQAAPLLGVIPTASIQNYFYAFDKDMNGVIDFAEFVGGAAAMISLLKDQNKTASQVIKKGRSVELVWDEPPKTVLLVKKPKVEEIDLAGREMAQWLKNEFGLKVMVDPLSHQRDMPDFEPFDVTAPGSGVDFMISLGGDGTLLYLASLFQKDEVIPPAISFGLGSLGFMTPFEVVDHKACLRRILNAVREPVYLSLRSRIRCEILSATGECLHTRHVLNECAISRGGAPYLTKLHVDVDGQAVTIAQADGLIISTPSGSTAYNLSAGGSLMAPSVPALLLTPIAPHTLSFRPLVLPDACQLKIIVDKGARSAVSVSFDGRDTQDVEKGASIIFSTSQCPFPVIDMHQLDYDWFNSIRQKLQWNVRVEQKPFLEE